ncbi:MAG: orotate phosphoribosyltransferase [Methanolinea sp.]|nr:orotate phosphoribosyltransferase [Methanolinea sp.]
MVNEIVQLLLRYGALEFGEFVLASGEKSSYYLDIKKVVTRPEALQLIAALIARRFEFDTVAGVAVGGVPLAVAVSLESKKPFAIVRSLEKGHGKSGRVIGDVSGRRVLLVEDVTTSGGSAIQGIRALREAGGIIDTAVVVVDREAGAVESLGREGVRLEALAKASEILNAGRENSKR